MGGQAPYDNIGGARPPAPLFLLPCIMVLIILNVCRCPHLAKVMQKELTIH